MSRLSEMLNSLAKQRGMSQAAIARRARELGHTVSKATVSNYFDSAPETPRQSVLLAFAAALDVQVEDLEAAANYTGLEPFQPHPSADQLTASQRTAVNEIIRLLADANRRAGTDDGTPMRPEGNFGTRHAPGDMDTDYDEVARRRDEKQAAADAVEYDGMAAADHTRDD